MTIATRSAHVLHDAASDRWTVKRGRAATYYASKYEAVHAAAKAVGKKNVIVHNREGQVLSTAGLNFPGSAKVRRAVEAVVARALKN